MVGPIEREFDGLLRAVLSTFTSCSGYRYSPQEKFTIDCVLLGVAQSYAFDMSTQEIVNTPMFMRLREAGVSSNRNFFMHGHTDATNHSNLQGNLKLYNTFAKLSSI